MTIHPTPSGRRSGPLLALACCSLLTALLVGILWPWPAPAAAAIGGPQAPPEPTPASMAAIATPAATDDAPPLQRTPVPSPPPPPLPGFEQLIEQLVTIGQQTAERAQADDFEAAQASDREARTALAALLQRFHDAGERALALVAALPEPTVDMRDHSRRVVLQLVLGAELARRDEQAEAAADRTRIDPLVESLLGVMPQTAGTTEVGAHLLVDQPYLCAAHERSVLGLVQLAAEGSFPRDTATRLLATLWHNLQRTGERSSAELSRLALLLLDDGDPSKRAVACRQLIADPRFRPMALAWVREHGDTEVANDLAGVAARELAPADALQVLRELAPILPHATGAYLVLGSRAPELIADAYREQLAANTQPDLRADLVAGVGLTGSPQARDVVQLALQSDPSPDVRIQAGLVLTANADADTSERALQMLLDDPAIARDATRLGAVVLALQNLEAGAAINQIDRLGQRLRTLPLSEASRQALEALLARSLPAGQVSSPASGGAAEVPR